MGVLLDQKQGQNVEVIELKGGSNFVSKLYKLGIKEGVKVFIKQKCKICPILLEVNGSTVAVGRGMAGKILVRKI